MNRKRRAGLLFALFFLWPALLVDPSGPPMSDSVLRAAVRVVEDGTWTLSDRTDPEGVFLTTAYDVSFHEGRAYSGVGPGASALAVPVYVLLRPVFALLGDDVMQHHRALTYYTKTSEARGEPPARYWKEIYLLQLFLVWVVVAPLFAAFVVRLDGWLLDRGVEPSLAFAVVASVGLGSMAVYYASMYSRQAIAYLLAWHALLTLMRTRSIPAIVISGVALGTAIAADYASVLLVGLVVIAKLREQRGRERVALLASIASVVALTIWYHHAAFGSVWATPYHYRFWYTSPYMAHRGIDLSAFQAGATLGANFPSLEVMGRLVFGGYKGLFVYSPVLFVGLVGHVMGLRHPVRRGLHLFCLAVFLVYLTLNSTLGTHVAEYGHHFWGGLSVLWGPRYLFAALPFLACGLAWLDWRNPVVRFAVAGALLVSIAINLLGTMFGDVLMATFAFDPKLESPIGYAQELLAERGPRIPLLARYGVATSIQILLLAAATVTSIVLGRLIVSTPGGKPAADRSSESVPSDEPVRT